LHQGVVAKPTYMEDHPVALVDNNPFVNVFAPEPHSKASSSGDISSTESTYVSQTLHHLNKWSKDHPLDNVIGNPSRPISTRKQLATDALCLKKYDIHKLLPQVGALPNTQSSSNEMRSLAMRVPEPERGSSVPIDLFTAFAHTQPVQSVTSIVDITEFFKKHKCVCHWANPFKDLKWSNVPGVKLSSLFKSDDTFPSLQALSDLHYLFGGFMDYLWSRELNISNFGPADR
nr:integrase, catalytic region, zinc finger, CCHC-type, peptidase aspartic, catalytic [Tanacetum cinerariifolium]